MIFLPENAFGLKNSLEDFFLESLGELFRRVFWGMNLAMIFI